MLNGNRDRHELAYSLLFTMPGTPMIQYGAEIGMGDDLSLPERNSVRTAMQWADAPNGGFSDTTEALIRPVISKGKYAYKNVNVAQQQCEPGSFLNWMERIIRLRRQLPELGSGQYTTLDAGNRKVFAHSSKLDYTLIAVQNLSSQEIQVSLTELQQSGVLVTEVFSNQPYKLPKDGEIELTAYGYRWFRLMPLPPSAPKKAKSKGLQTKG